MSPKHPFVFLPMMKRPEIAVFARSILDAIRRPGAFVEIGVGKGGSSCFLLWLLNAIGEKRVVRSVDVSPEAKRFWDGRAAPQRNQLDAEFVLSESTQAARTLKVDPIAWLLIDGCHCRRCVSLDMDAWLPRLPPGAIVVFHDSGAAVPDTLTCLRDRKVKPVEVHAALAENAWVGENLEKLDEVDGPGLCGIVEYRRRASPAEPSA